MLLDSYNFPETATRIRFPDDEDDNGWYAISYVAAYGLGIIFDFTKDSTGENVARGRHIPFAELLEEHAQWSSGNGEWISFRKEYDSANQCDK